MGWVYPAPYCLLVCVMPDVIQELINAWSIDFYAGWSFMDVFSLGAFLFWLAVVIRYFYERLGNK